MIRRSEPLSHPVDRSCTAVDSQRFIPVIVTQLARTGLNAVLVLCSMISLPTWATASDKPNIIIVLADDQGYGDVSANNAESKIPTPHIDRLAKEGMRFTDAHFVGSLHAHTL